MPYASTGYTRTESAVRRHGRNRQMVFGRSCLFIAILLVGCDSSMTLAPQLSTQTYWCTEMQEINGFNDDQCYYLGVVIDQLVNHQHAICRDAGAQLQQLWLNDRFFYVSEDFGADAAWVVPLGSGHYEEAVYISPHVFEQQPGYADVTGLTGWILTHEMGHYIYDYTDGYMGDLDPVYGSECDVHPH